MVVQTTTETPTRNQVVWDVLNQVMDPEIPIISVVDLGIVRGVHEEGGRLEVIVTPTYTGCPATKEIEADIRQALDAAGFEEASMRISLSPAWTTEWITKRGREQLKAFGIAPPEGSAGKRALFSGEANVACPRCASRDTEQISEFGSTACKSLWRCCTCREPFDYFKCI